MSRFGFNLVLILLILLHFSCKKDVIEPLTTYTSLGNGLHIRSICFADSVSGFVAGGSVGTSGFIYQTDNGGSTWNPVLQTDWCIYDINFLDNLTGCACGDSLKILKTMDGGLSWNAVQLSWFPDPEFIVPLKNIEFADATTWYFCGGDQYKAGVNIRTQDGGGWWDMQVFQASLNASYFRDATYGLLAGYGVVYITQDTNVSFSYSDFEGDNLTGLSFMSPAQGVACGYNGGIYKTTDGGHAWETVVSPNGYLGTRTHFNGIVSIQNAIVAAGNNGFIYYSSDHGNSWTETSSPTDENLLAVTFHRGHYWAVGQNGSIVAIRF